MSNRDLVEIDPSAEHHIRFVLGPPSLPACDANDYEQRLEPFRALFDGSKCLDLLDWWVQGSLKDGRCRVNDRSWVSELAALGPVLSLTHREGDSRVFRYRYFGSTLADRFGADLTGTVLTDGNNMTEDECFELWRPTLEEGRPTFMQMRFGPLFKNRAFLRATLLCVPLLDRDLLPRYGLAVYQFHEIAL